MDLKEAALSACEGREFEVRSRLRVTQEELNSSVVVERDSGPLFLIDQRIFLDGPFEVDGLKLSFGNYADNGRNRLCFQVWDVCPDCGQEVPSRTLYYLEDLGRALKHFKPNSHGCPIAKAQSRCTRMQTKLWLLSRAAELGLKVETECPVCGTSVELEDYTETYSVTHSKYRKRTPGERLRSDFFRAEEKITWSIPKDNQFRRFICPDCEHVLYDSKGQ